MYLLGCPISGQYKKKVWFLTQNSAFRICLNEHLASIWKGWRVTVASDNLWSTADIFSWNPRFIARFEETLHEWKLVSQRALPPVAKVGNSNSWCQHRLSGLTLSKPWLTFTYFLIIRIPFILEKCFRGFLKSRMIFYHVRIYVCIKRKF